jgi:hypothetical protein
MLALWHAKLQHNRLQMIDGECNNADHNQKIVISSVWHHHQMGRPDDGSCVIQIKMMDTGLLPSWLAIWALMACQNKGNN